MKKLKITILIFIFFLLLLLFTDIYLLFLKPLDTGGNPNRDFGDILLVLGGGLKTLKEIGVSTSERLDLAVELFKKKKTRILVSDGSLYKKSPAIAMIKNYLTGKGIPEDYILLEGKSQTTFENFMFSRKMINDLKLKEVLVCTSPYHQKRSQIIKNHFDLNNYKVVKMDRSEIYQAKSFKQRLRNLKLILREYFGLLKFVILKR